MEDTAETVLQIANKKAPRPGNSQGYALGALVASGYVSTPTKGDKEYYKAVSAAMAVPETRIVTRDQILPMEAPPPDSGTRRTAWVNYPLSYAMLMEHGFWHENAQTFIPGSHFLYDATVEAHADFNTAFYDLLDELKQFKILTPREKVLARREAREEAEAEWERRQAREASRLVREERDLLKDEFFAAYGRDILQLQKGRVKGFTSARKYRDMQGKLQAGGSRIRVRTGMETKSERDERVENLFQEWLAQRATREQHG